MSRSSSPGSSTPPSTWSTGRGPRPSWSGAGGAAKRGEMTIAEIDLRVGGTWRYVMVDERRIRGRLPRRVPRDRPERADRLDRGLRGHARRAGPGHRDVHRGGRPDDPHAPGRAHQQARTGTCTSSPGWRTACRTRWTSWSRWRSRLPERVSQRRPLEGRVALVAGATRGAGRGTAVALGEAGATVYCTGRSTRERRSEYDRPETIEETAELVTAAGGDGDRGRGRPPRGRARSRRSCGGSTPSSGRLDVLVNDIWGGEQLFEWDTPVWEHDLDEGAADAAPRRSTPT